MRKKVKVYLAGGMRSKWQEEIINALGDKFEFFNPAAHKLVDVDQYTVWDVHHIQQSDIVFAFMEMTNPSGYGLAFELGLAHGLGKTIILVDEKSVTDADFCRYFRIVTNSSDVVFDDYDEGVNYLRSFSRS